MMTASTLTVLPLIVVFLFTQRYFLRRRGDDGIEGVGGRSGGCAGRTGRDRRMGKRVRAGLIGCGSVSQVGVLPQLTQPDARERIDLAALCDVVEARARAVAERSASRTPMAMPARCSARDDIDLVLVITPIAYHYPMALAALNAGKHVYVQKTMTETYAQAQALVDEAAARDFDADRGAGPDARSGDAGDETLVDRDGARRDLLGLGEHSRLASRKRTGAARRRHPPLGRSDLVLHAERRAAARRDRLRAAQPDRHLRPGSARRRDVRHPRSGAALARQDDSGRNRRQHFALARFRRCAIRAGRRPQRADRPTRRMGRDGHLRHGRIRRNARNRACCRAIRPNCASTPANSRTDLRPLARAVFEPVRTGCPASRPSTPPSRSRMSTPTSSTPSNASNRGGRLVASGEHAAHVIEIIERGYDAARTGVTQDLESRF